MEIGKYKQALSHLLKDDPLKNITFNSEARLVDNDPIGYAAGGRVGFKDGKRIQIKNNVLEAYNNLKKDLNREPSLVEMIQKTGKGREVILNNLEGKKLSQGRLLEAGKTGNAASVEAFKAREVDKPTSTFYEGKLGVKWPDKETEKKYVQQIKERYKYPAQSFPFYEKVKTGELLTDKGLAEEFGITPATVERINKYIKNNEGLTYPITKGNEWEKEKAARRRDALIKNSLPSYEKEMSGNKKTHLSHMSDLYNIKVTPETIGYAPSEINIALSEKVDPALKSIIEEQKKLYKNKPFGYKQKIEDLNVKGMDYSAQTGGYKVFEALDPDTGKRFIPITSPEKTIDPTGVAEKTPLKNLTEEQKAQLELNRESVFKAQSKIPASEKKKIVQMINLIGCPQAEYADGGRVNFSEGSNCYIKGIEKLQSEEPLAAKEINAVKNALQESGVASSEIRTLTNLAKQGGKNLLQGFDELMIFGRSPIGRLAGYGLGIGLPAYSAAEEALKGNYKQMGRELGNIPTLGFGLPESWVGSNKGDLINHAKEKGLDDDAVERFFNKSEISKKINDAEELLNMGSTNEKFIKSVEDRKKSLYDEYNNIKLSPADIKNFNTTLKSFTEENYGKTLLSEEMQKNKTARDVNKYYTENLDPDFISENKIKISPNKTETPLEDLSDYSQLSMADGGRVKLEGGGGPKMGRRGFLGLLAGAAAAAPELLKTIKGTSQVSKVASKIKLEPAQGMYSWFPDLVEKIKIKGKPFEEPYTIMEASYKHEARGYGGLPKGEEKLTRHIDGDTEFVLREYPDGRIAVDIHSPRNQEGLDTPVTLYYRPKMELQYHTGKKVDPAEFKVLEKEPRYFANGPDDVDIEMSEKVKIPGRDTIFGDIEAAERFATGDIKNRKVIPTKQSIRNQMEDAPVDFIESHTPYGSYDPPTEILE